MAFEWNPAKAASNLSKHGVSFELAQEVWDDPFHVILPDRFEDGEQRWHALGLVGPVTVWWWSTPILFRTMQIWCGLSVHEKRPRTNGNVVKTKSRKPELQAQLDTLAALPENDIDTDDIPEAAPENWLHPKRPGLYRPIKKPLTLRLDADEVEWFKDHAPAGGYQTEINRVLRRHVAGR